MFSQLLDLLKTLGTTFLPFTVVDAWQHGVVLRFGRVHRVAEPGFHFIWPFAEQVFAVSVVTTTTTLSAQTLLAPDGKLYTIEGVVRWSVADARAFVERIWDGGNVIVDCCKGAIATALRDKGVDGIDAQILKNARTALSKYGIKVEAVTLTTMATVRVFRMISSSSHEPIQNEPA